MRAAALPAACGLALLLAGDAAAQDPGRAGGRGAEDTLPPVVPLDEMVVTGARAPTPLGTSVVGVTRLEAAELGRLPVGSFAEVLGRVPGVALLDVGGTGFDPRLAVRGFYGGGEAEYVVVLLDGRPLNDLQTGLVAWDLVPPVAVRSVEVVRGGLSALWGDAAIGGVVNVITEGPGASPAGDWQLEGGGHGAVEGGVRLAGPSGWADRAGSVFATGRREDGFREHGAGKAASVGGEIDLLGGEDGGGRGAAGPEDALTLSLASAWRDLERPGPLSAEALAEDRRASHPFYRFDHTEEWVHRVALDGASGAGWSGSLTGELRTADVVRTLPLAPDFADTKARELEGRRLLATVRHQGSGPGLTPGDRLVVGVDASLGSLDSEYHRIVSGPPEAYAAASGARQGPDARGEAGRWSAAAFAQYEARPLDALRLTLGARVDWLRDRHEAFAVEGGSGAAGTGTRTHRAFSPKAGLNLRYLETAGQRGHVYLAAGRSFKAPTLDQLFDQRSIPVPFPPFTATTSNPDLEPQHGVQLEAGAYHAAALSSATTARLSLSVYRMDMEDELDFDVQSLRYVNIGRSRHEGVELGLEATAPGATRLFANWALQAATNEGGDHAGRRLKAIPEHFVSAGVSTRLPGGLDGGLFLTRASGAWLDDANTLPLDPWTRIDARIGRTVAGASVFLEARNLLDRRYSTTGFPDPSGADVVYYHPAAGRTLSLGMRSGG